jgi:dihydrodipicolinate synthase/N-acetylneuraminate lyase
MDEIAVSGQVVRHQLPSLAEQCEKARRRLCHGLLIPAHPLALTAERKLDERRQQALSRYYVEAGCGGLAVGVHTTQFAIRKPQVSLYAPVLTLAMETAQEYQIRPVMIAGILGDTVQALAEAALARDLGYDAVLVSLAGLGDWNNDQLLAHCRRIGECMPIMGFYLQPAAGGIPLSYSFWRRFAEIESVVGIKIAPFNRYHTLDVVRAVVDSGRYEAISLYTGNDDSILQDLLAPFSFVTGGPGGQLVEARIVGGLLGHWAVWTQTAVRILEQVHAITQARAPIPQELMQLANQITDANAAFFDAANAYRGCIAGIHDVLRRQGLLEGIWCLDPDECLSPGQAEEIDRVYRAYPHLNDDAFVAEHRDRWLR